MIHGGDLQFVVLMASKMAEMSASDDMLAGKSAESPDAEYLLDDELRSLQRTRAPKKLKLVLCAAAL